MTSAPLEGSDRIAAGPLADGTGTAPSVRPSRPRRPGGSAPYWFLVPTLALFAAFTVVPIGYAIWLSLHKVKVKGIGLGKGAREQVWNGLGNYTDVFQDFRARPLVLRPDRPTFPITLGLYTLLAQGASQPALYTLVITGCLLAILPLIALFLVIQRFWSLDLLSGSIKS
ncbi:hypothetical protein SALBM311S_12349 [Streptomyces alboniger]